MRLLIRTGNFEGLYEPEDTIVTSIEFENGLLYNGSWCFVSAGEAAEDVIEILGASGSIRFSCFRFTPIELGVSWATIKAASGSTASAFQGGAGRSFLENRLTSGSSGEWTNLRRGVFTMNTSSIPDGDDIDSAVFSLWFYYHK